MSPEMEHPGSFGSLLLFLPHLEVVNSAMGIVVFVEGISSIQVDRECGVSLITHSHISRRSTDLLLPYMIRLVPSLFNEREDC